MNTEQKHTISSEKALELLNNGQPILNSNIEGKLKIEIAEHNWDKEVIFKNCTIKFFSGSVTLFEKPVKFINCHFKECLFISSYFLGGLVIENCTFDNYLDFQAGGHNKTGNSVTIINNNFQKFVNFFDCWFENEVTISYNKFHKGTNFLGKTYNTLVTFDVEPIIKDNIGKLDFNNEGYENEQK